MFVRRHTGVARETNGLTCGCVDEEGRKWEDERKKGEGRNRVDREEFSYLNRPSRHIGDST